MKAPEDPAVRRALLSVMRRLQHRSLLEAEVREGLERKGYEEFVVDEVVAFLRSHRLVDDRRAAQDLAEHMIERRGYAVQAVLDELERRGAPAEVAALVAASGDPAEAALCALAERRPPPKTPLQAARFLASRGHEEEAVEEAVRTFFREEQP